MAINVSVCLCLCVCEVQGERWQTGSCGNNVVRDFKMVAMDTSALGPGHRETLNTMMVMKPVINLTAVFQIR